MSLVIRLCIPPLSSAIVPVVIRCALERTVHSRRRLPRAASTHPPCEHSARINHANNNCRFSRTRPTPYSVPRPSSNFSRASVNPDTTANSIPASLTHLLRPLSSLHRPSSFSLLVLCLVALFHSFAFCVPASTVLGHNSTLASASNTAVESHSESHHPDLPSLPTMMQLLPPSLSASLCSGDPGFVTALIQGLRLYGM